MIRTLKELKAHDTFRSIAGKDTFVFNTDGLTTTYKFEYLSVPAIVYEASPEETEEHYTHYIRLCGDGDKYYFNLEEEDVKPGDNYVLSVVRQMKEYINGHNITTEGYDDITALFDDIIDEIIDADVFNKDNETAREMLNKDRASLEAAIYERGEDPDYLDIILNDNIAYLDYITRVNTARNIAIFDAAKLFPEIAHEIDAATFTYNI